MPLWNDDKFKEVFMMKNFWKDYAHLCKESGKFYKKHLLGVIVMNAVVIGAELAYFNRGRIKDAIEEKFHKEEEA